jgi:Tfp pilus assembly protein PilN
MFYVVLILALALACAAGMLYFYLLFLEGRIRQQQRRIVGLEQRCAALSEELRSAEALLADERERDERSWPELIDENDDYSMS